MPLSLTCAEAAAALRSMPVASRQLFMTLEHPVSTNGNGEHAATRPVDPIRVGSGRVSCHSGKIQTDASNVRARKGAAVVIAVLLCLDAGKDATGPRRAAQPGDPHAASRCRSHRRLLGCSRRRSRVLRAGRELSGRHRGGTTAARGAGVWRTRAAPVVVDVKTVGGAHRAVRDHRPAVGMRFRACSIVPGRGRLPRRSLREGRSSLPSFLREAFGDRPNLARGEVREPNRPHARVRNRRCAGSHHP